MESVASDASSGAAEVGNCDCGGGGCSARGNRPLEGRQVDRRAGDVILAAPCAHRPLFSPILGSPVARPSRQRFAA